MGVRLYVKPGCPLCDEVRDWLEDLGVQPEEVNILSDETLNRDFKDVIPVVAVGGLLLTLPFTKRRLRAWLARALAGSPR
ncbi:MAG: glutaredoxin family protein [Dehalococcoidia bacterium]|nr:glutaredoxin family protein [Dehalococcoidia bacterium]